MSNKQTYNPSSCEQKWYQHWNEKNYFHSEVDDRVPYSIVIPPPNVTGVLHMGHILNNTIQDILIRRARLQGKNACWVPGTDHASIATEAKVVKMLEEKGVNKDSLSRNDFMKSAWEWKEKYGGIILNQLQRIGASCDWDRTKFTMDDDMYSSVIKVFVDLYNKGLIYKGSRMVNWDPQAKTALSDEEVIYKEVDSQLFYVDYDIKNSSEKIRIATTRPETILGDTAICVHPEDERFKALVGKTAIVPLVNREIPIITDEYVDPEFGTGALKITPAHDPNDHELGKKHKLDTINILDESGKLSENAILFIGTDRFEARKLVAAKLQESGNLVKTDELNNKVGFSERTDSVIEPRLSEQWFCKMQDLAKPALEMVMYDEIEFYPAKFKNTYKHWMENIRDWCISRQLWWGQRIPAYYLANGEYVVAENEEKALELAIEKTGDKNLNYSDLRQDEDVLDTWFSSWLWPMSVFNGVNEPDNKEIQYYYPTEALVTGSDIIFFWVARMIMAGLEYRDEKPFKKVYFTGMVRDMQGRKMSKSLGNSPDVFQLIDQYGADAVRFGVLISSPAGNDLKFEEKLCEQGRNFANKLYNAHKLVLSWKANDKISDEISANIKDRNSLSISLLKGKIKQTLESIEKNFSSFRVSANLTEIYRLIWDDFCSNYLEWIKPGKEDYIDSETYEASLDLFDDLLKILHPFMPFVTEELWHSLRKRDEGDDLMVSSYPDLNSQEGNDGEMDKVISFITAIRNFRAENEIKSRLEIPVSIKTTNSTFYDKYANLLKKAAVLKEIKSGKEVDESNQVIVFGSDEVHIHIESEIDTSAQLSKLQEELDYTEGFLKQVNKKLGNEGFVKNAKAEVVDKERQKQADAEAKIKQLKESIAKLAD